jgi:hypothetical protein
MVSQSRLVDTVWDEAPPARAANALQARMSRLREFGYIVAVSADGTTALIGGPADNDNVGAAWIFGPQLVGSPQIQPNVDSNPAGTAEAFRYTATGTGSTGKLSVYLDATSAAFAGVRGAAPGCDLTMGSGRRRAFRRVSGCRPAADVTARLAAVTKDPTYT